MSFYACPPCNLCRVMDSSLLYSVVGITLNVPALQWYLVLGINLELFRFVCSKRVCHDRSVRIILSY